MDIFGMSDIGKKRDSNQDAFFYLKIDDDSCFAFVCDGMGGQNGGDVASNMVKDLFCDKINKKLEENFSIEEIKELIFDAYKEVNGKIFEKSISDESLSGMGTTCITVFLHKEKLMVFNVGDSRVYVSSNFLLKQLTVDHSYVQTLVDCGKISKEEARVHPRKNEITKAVGISKEIKIDFKCVDVAKGDFILLCSDGLTNCCSDEQIKVILEEEKGVVSNCVKSLIDFANFNGGNDNITAILIKI